MSRTIPSGHIQFSASKSQFYWFRRCDLCCIHFTYLFVEMAHAHQSNEEESQSENPIESGKFHHVRSARSLNRKMSVLECAPLSPMDKKNPVYNYQLYSITNALSRLSNPCTFHGTIRNKWPINWQPTKWSNKFSSRVETTGRSRIWLDACTDNVWPGPHGTPHHSHHNQLDVD